jgi:hypothetical protein
MASSIKRQIKSIHLTVCTLLAAIPVSAALLPSSRRLVVLRVLGMLCIETYRSVDVCIHQTVRSAWQASSTSPVLTDHSSVVM